MKSFGFYKTSAVKRFVSEYSPDEHATIKTEFMPVAARYRHRVRLAAWVVVLGMIYMVLGGIIGIALKPVPSSSYYAWFAIGFVIWWFILLLFTLVRCECPGCHNDLARGFGPFCPECGGRSLQRGNWFRPPLCSSCGKRMAQGKGRHYKVRACTHCGLFLDAEGL